MGEYDVITTCAIGDPSIRAISNTHIRYGNIVELHDHTDTD
jgi:hypothetical protein